MQIKRVIVAAYRLQILEIYQLGISSPYIVLKREKEFAVSHNKVLRTRKNN